MSLTYTNQHYEWKERVNKETMFAIRFNQYKPGRFYNTTSGFQKTFPALQRLNSNNALADAQNQKGVSNFIRPKTSLAPALSPNRSGSNGVSNNLKSYIKELESQLRSEQLKRIKSESLLKSYTILNQNPKGGNLKSSLKSKDLKRPN